MTFRRFLHVLAIVFSSLFAMITHGHSDPATTKKPKKNGLGQMSKPATSQDNGSDDPPHHIDPAVLAAEAQSPQPTMFGSFVTMMPYPEKPANAPASAPVNVYAGSAESK